MADLRAFGGTSNLVRFTLKQSPTGAVPGDGLTGLSSASSGLVISTIADNEATATAYTVAGGTIESITTLGTFATPTATKCRFREVDAVNHMGLYEFQFANARFAVTGAQHLIISVSGAASLQDADYEIQFNAPVSLMAILGTALTESVAGYLAAGFKKLFDVATPVFTLASVNQTGDNLDSSGVTTLLARLGVPAGASVSADIAEIEAETDVIVAGLGGFSGTGLNTVLGFLRAIMRKDAALTPSDVGGTFDNSEESLEALEDQQPFVIV